MNITVLDHGYVKHIESWGGGLEGRAGHSFEESDDNEVGIIEAARQSTQGSFRGWERDARLLMYLHEHKHDTPFEFAGMVIEVQAPIFVFREWHRHRTQSYNEMSARYSPLPNLNYIPTEERLLAGTNQNKQSDRIDGGRPLRKAEASLILREMNTLYEDAENTYQAHLNAGVPKELARLILPVGRYSRMRACANLRNWLAFLTLRMSPDAQQEIRLYAEAVGKIIKQEFPRTWELFSSSQGEKQ